MRLVRAQIKKFIPNKSTCRLFALLINLARIVVVYREYKANHVISSQVTWLITSHVDVTHRQLKRFWLASHNFGKHKVFVIFQYRYLFELDGCGSPMNCICFYKKIYIIYLTQINRTLGNICYYWHKLYLSSSGCIKIYVAYYK